ncbi:MAG: ABC transporter permease [Candidatus Aminicenantes bacterium]|nr:ABC transporter permease [Candidatus Aminicenantes bacterium]
MGDIDEISREIEAAEGPAAARRWKRGQAARLIFSSLADSLAWRFMMFQLHWKTTWRNLKKHPGYTAINIGGMAVGLACCLVILMWIRTERSYDRFHSDADRLHLVYTQWDEGEYGTYLPGPLSAHLEREYPEIAGASVFSTARNVKIAAGPEKGLLATIGLVEPSFLEMFTFPLLKGDPRSALRDPASVVITEALAERLFGRDDPVGKTIQMNDGKTDKIVTGLIRRIPDASSLQFDLLASSAAGRPFLKDWRVNSTPIFVRLRDGASAEDVGGKIAGILKARDPEHSGTLGLQPLLRLRLFELGGGGRIVQVRTFAAMALLILLIAAINFMNLSTARSERRAREVGIKKVLGSRRGAIVEQFLSESVLLAICSMVVAVLLVGALLPRLAVILGQPMSLKLSWPLAGSVGLLALFVGLLSGGYPAFLLSGISPQAAFKGHRRMFFRGGRGRTRGSALRKTLVVVQLTLSVFFIFAVIVVHRQMGFVASKTLGFDKDNVLVLSLRGQLADHGALLKREILGNPAVESAALVDNDLDGWYSSSTADWTGKNPGDDVVLGLNWVDADFLKVLKLEMAAGRFFSSEFPGDPAEAVVINEAAVRAMGMDQPLGRKITVRMGETLERTVVGVVKDFHTESLHAPVGPYMLFCSDAAPNLYVRIKPGDLPRTLQGLERTVKTIVPNDPFRYSFLNQSLDRLYASERSMSRLVLAGAALAILISCLGLYGLVSYLAEQRTKEIAVRKVLGASGRGIAGLFLRELGLGAVLATFLAAPVSFWAAGRWLGGFAFRVSLPIWLILPSGALVLAIAVAAVLSQTLRAAAAHPAQAIRNE